MVESITYQTASTKQFQINEWLSYSTYSKVWSLFHAKSSQVKEDRASYREEVL